MCDVGHHEEILRAAEDEFILNTPVVQKAVALTRTLRAGAAGPTEALEAIKPIFAELMRDRTWLPQEFQRECPNSKMGGGIGQWLLYRASDSSLCLFSLVVPAGSMTPIHDHLAWGLIGLYQGHQDEEFYAPQSGKLNLVRRRPLVPGDFYALMPPFEDIHRVRTTSKETSVSVHLLANDTGCTVRNTYDETTGERSPFRSGYVNAPCPE